MERFRPTPINLSRVAGAKRDACLQTLKRGVRSGTSTTEANAVYHDTICSREFQIALNAFRYCRLLIADEMHNLERPSIVSGPPMFFEYRLGLSATLTRQHNEDGSKALQDFFGQFVFGYTLEEAINSCFVEYDYCTSDRM